MNYQRHYDLLVSRAKDRVLSGYSERHHILPRCMGGGDSPENLVRLTPEEHFFAHELLTKLNPGNRMLAHAAKAMAKKATGRRAYGWLRRRHAALMRGNKFSLGVKLSAERKKAKSEFMRGNKFAVGNKNRVGKKHTEESRRKMSEALIGKPTVWLGRKHSQETKDKIAAARIGKPLPPEVRAKMSASARKRGPFTPETRERMSIAQRKRFGTYAAR